MTAKEYLQKKHEWHRKHWNEHEHIDDEWWANEMEEYHQAKLKLLGIAGVVGRSEQLKAFLDYCDEAGWIKNIDKQRIIKDYTKSL
ncbi:hypothetical protein EP331_00275 [bacterium]|nr:MAG: hypothetical protein EP331_00275 [bacterium]